MVVKSSKALNKDLAINKDLVVCLKPDYKFDKEISSKDRLSPVIKFYMVTSETIYWYYASVEDRNFDLDQLIDRQLN